MNTDQSHHKQKGFFDFGLGLAILAVIGVATVLLKPDKTNPPQERAALCLEEHQDFDNKSANCK